MLSLRSSTQQVILKDGEDSTKTIQRLLVVKRQLMVKLI